MNAKKLRADEVLPGDVIDWCGMRAKVDDVSPDHRLSRRRAGLYLTVEVPGMGERRRLHYWADELVTVAR